MYLLAAIIAVIGRGSVASAYRNTALSFVIAGSLAWLGAAAAVLASGSTVYHDFYHLTPGLSIAFRLDRLASFFLLAIVLVAVCVSIYSFRYVRHVGNERRQAFLVAAMAIFVMAMGLTVASANFFSFLVFWEIMSIASLLLVLTEREKPETAKAGIYYLVMTQFATMFLLIGTLLFQANTGTLDMAHAGGLTQAAGGVLFLVFLVGFGTKAGIIPFHKWLPFAHAAAPSGISALMSGVMLKVAVYGLFRLVLDVLTPEIWWGAVLLGFGIVSAVLGVIYALKEHDLKKLLAYHSIENIGIIVIGLGLFIIFDRFGLTGMADLALYGALFHTLNHAIFKSLLFMTAGSVVAATHTRNIEEMGGLVKKMPATAVLFLIGAAAISALPPLNGFASEVMLFQGFLGAFQIPSQPVAILLFASLAAFALMSALAAACFVKAFGTVFLALPRSAGAAEAGEVHRSMVVGPGILAVFCVVLGIFSFQIFQGIGLELPIPDLLPVSLIVIGVFTLAVLMVRRTGAGVRVSETWGCGIHRQTSRMEYTATGFSEPIITVFSPIFRTVKMVQRKFGDRFEANITGGTGEIHTWQFFEERIYLPVARFVGRISGFVSRLHNADLDAFILYAFVFIVIILILAGWWL